MCDTYQVTLNGQGVGEVKVEKQGLYYLFFCKCRLVDKKKYTLQVVCSGKKELLGVCVPAGEWITLTVRRKIKNFGTGELLFYLNERDESIDRFVPVFPEKPFPMMEDLRQCYYKVKNGKEGIALRS